MPVWTWVPNSIGVLMDSGQVHICILLGPAAALGTSGAGRLLPPRGRCRFQGSRLELGTFFLKEGTYEQRPEMATSPAPPGPTCGALQGPALSLALFGAQMQQLGKLGRWHGGQCSSMQLAHTSTVLHYTTTPQDGPSGGQSQLPGEAEVPANLLQVS